MTLSLELGAVQDPNVRHAFEHIAQQFPIQERNMALRTVCGRVDGATGNVLSGSGFTSARTAVGVYTVTFTPAFAAIPTLVATANDWVVTYTARSASACTLIVFVSTTGATIDRSFDFIALGF